MKVNISVEEKIDYIYTTLHKQETRHKWWVILKWWFRLAILIYIYILIVYMLPWIIDNITAKFTPDISSNNIDAQALMEKAKEILNY